MKVKEESEKVGLKLKFRRRKWQPTPVLLPGKSLGRRSLVGYSPWGHKELDTTDGLHFHFSPKLSNRRCVPNSIEHVCAQNAGTKVFLVVPLVTALRWKGFQCPSAMGWDKSSVVISAPKENQPWIFAGRTDAEAKAPVLQPPNAKSWLTGKDPHAGKDWR